MPIKTILSHIIHPCSFPDQHAGAKGERILSLPIHFIQKFVYRMSPIGGFHKRIMLKNIIIRNKVPVYFLHQSKYLGRPLDQTDDDWPAI